MHFHQWKRRDFITLLGGATAWPLAARAQKPDRMRHIGVLMHTTSDEPESQARLAAFLQGLQEAGWSIGRNVRVDTRWSGAIVYACVRMRRTWSGSTRTSSWPASARPHQRCNS